MISWVIYGAVYVFMAGLWYVNYLARVKYGDYFEETTSIWRWFDKRGQFWVAQFLYFLLVTSFLVVTYLNDIGELVYMILGGLAVNFLDDLITFEQGMKCILSNCPISDTKKICLDCELQDRYDLIFTSLTTFKLKEKKHKTLPIPTQGGCELCDVFRGRGYLYCYYCGKFLGDDKN